MRRPSIVILAGGKGTRLRSITNDEVPKPMVEIGSLPFLYHLIKNYLSQGFEDIIISVGHKEECIRNYPWPRSWDLQFISDKLLTKKGYLSYYDKENWWVVNGDTFIIEELPFVDGPTIVSVGTVDAGAQFTGRGKIHIEPSRGFFDIGTPEGLEAFKVYFKTHLVNKY